MTEAIVQEVSKVQDRQTLRELEYAIRERRAAIRKQEQEARDAKRRAEDECRVDAQWGAWIHSLEHRGKSADGTKDYYFDPRNNTLFGIQKKLSALWGVQFSVCQVFACPVCGKGALDKDYPGYCSKECQDKMLDVMAKDMIGGETNE